MCNVQSIRTLESGLDIGLCHSHRVPGLHILRPSHMQIKLQTAFCTVSGHEAPTTTMLPTIYSRPTIMLTFAQVLHNHKSGPDENFTRDVLK